MTLTDEQVKQAKESLLNQIDEAQSIPDEKKKELKEKVNAMGAEEIENTLKQQQSQNQQQGSGGSGTQQQCVFCSIIFGDVPSFNIGESKNAIAVLDIRPISEGHSIIVPREHIESYDSLPGDAFDLANAIGNKIKQILTPKDIKIFSSNLFGHQIINVLPVYNNEDENSERQDANKEKLQEIQGKLSLGKISIENKSPDNAQNSKENKEGKESSQEKEEINEENTWLPRRVP